MLKIIHHIVGPKQNELTKKCLGSWECLKKYGFQFMIWDDETIEDLIRTHFDFALEAFTTARNHGEAADIGRYLIVYYHGGYYVDWDIELTIPSLFLELHDCHKQGYLLNDPVNGSFAAEYFAAQKNEEYLMRISKDIVGTFNRGERELMTTPNYSGPYRMKVSHAQHKGTSPAILPIKSVFEYDYWEIKKAKPSLPTKAMIHYWMHSWLN